MMLVGPSASTVSSDDVKLSNGRIVCRVCKTHIAFANNLESKAFRGHDGGKAALFSEISNIKLCDRPQVRLMTTGAHTVDEFECAKCKGYLGFCFLRASEWSERWKVGKFVVERRHVAAERATVDPQTAASPVEKREFEDEQKWRARLAASVERTARWRADVFIAHGADTAAPAVQSTSSSAPAPTTSLRRKGSRHAGQWDAAFRSYAPIMTGA